MRILAIWLVTLLLGSCISCSAKPPVQWPAVARCASVPHGELTERVARVVLGDGGPDSTLLTERATAELEDLARQHGPDTVACVLDQVIAALTPPEPRARAAAPEPTAPETTAAVERCRNFLAKVGTTVERVP